MSYDYNSNTRAFDVSKEEVINRWSWYVGSMGMDAVKKQSDATVFLIGLDALGVEIAKNLVLTGVKKLYIYDKERVYL